MNAEYWMGGGGLILVVGILAKQALVAGFPQIDISGLDQPTRRWVAICLFLLTSTLGTLYARSFKTTATATISILHQTQDREAASQAQLEQAMHANQ